MATCPVGPEFSKTVLRFAHTARLNEVGFSDPGEVLGVRFSVYHHVSNTTIAAFVLKFAVVKGFGQS
jgi:hypothetical protein